MAVLAPPNNVDDVSGSIAASLLAQNALALASWDRRGLALRGAEVVLWSKTVLASHEAGPRKGIVDFIIHIVFEEVALGSQGTFIASHATLTR